MWVVLDLDGGSDDPGAHCFGPFPNKDEATIWAMNHDELEHGGSEYGFGVFEMEVRKP